MLTLCIRLDDETISKLANEIATMLKEKDRATNKTPPDELLDTKLDKIRFAGNVHTRIQNTFDELKIVTVRELIELSDADLLKHRMIGRASLSSLVRWLRDRGLDLQEPHYKAISHLRDL